MHKEPYYDAKEKLVETLTVFNDALETISEDMTESDYTDINSDMSVLQNMLDDEKQEKTH